MIKTAIIGASGFIGGHLLGEYSKEFPDTIGTSFSTVKQNLQFFDIRDPHLTALGLEDHGTQSIIITSAKANVEYCEINREASSDVNVRGMLSLIEQIGKTSMQTIFLSTDYVFEGTTGGYRASDPTNPTTEYGRQKALVELTIPSLTDNFMIIRLSKIFGISKDDGTLLDAMASELARGGSIQAAYDQFFCPTYVKELISGIQYLQQMGARGTFNLCNPEAWSRYKIALRLAEKMGVDPIRVKKITLHGIQSMRNRPLNTSMECSLAEDIRNVIFTSLEQHLDVVAAQWRLASR